jgi:ABC-type uncharacterized transport system ATPase subunit
MEQQELPRQDLEAPDNSCVVQMQHITKTFPGIRANDDISLDLRHGEIHALLGENGAGKSTLMSVLFGLYRPDSGSILINGQEARIKDPNDANRYGIGMVHQHFMLIDCFTGLENIILGAEPADALGVLHPKKVRKLVEDLCAKYHFTVDLDAKISDMPVGMQQKVEILKMLYRDNKILIFDEPTAVLTPQEIDELMDSMRSLTKEGRSILFISHKLNEIMDVADRVTVLRKGRCIGTLNVKDTNVQELSNMMVGRPVQLVVQKDEAKPGEPILSVRHLSVYSHEKHKNVADDVSFDVRKGEIMCIAGIEGNGQTELIYGITGIMPVKTGHVYLRNIKVQDKDRSTHLENIEIEKMSIRKRNHLGISHIPEDRHRYGLVLDFDLKSNFVLERYYLPPFSKHGWMNFLKIKDYSDEMIGRYDVRSGQGSASIVRSMSGGNQQKAIVGRELDRDTPLLIACQPTRGLDVGAIEYIHKEIVAHRDEGKAILLMSLELDEVFNLADRILVMYEGHIVADLDPKKTSMEEIGLYMSGAKKMELPALEDVIPGPIQGSQTAPASEKAPAVSENNPQPVPEEKAPAESSEKPQVQPAAETAPADNPSAPQAESEPEVPADKKPADQPQAPAEAEKKTLAPKKAKKNVKKTPASARQKGGR